jgi:hypothetical protein
MSALVWKSNVPKRLEAHWAEKNYVRLSTEMKRVRLTRGVRGVTYHADNLTSYGDGDRNRSWLIVIGPKGGKRSLVLGCYNTMDEAKRACEQHWADGCDLTGTQPELTRACDRAEARAALAAIAAA